MQCTLILNHYQKSLELQFEHFALNTSKVFD